MTAAIHQLNTMFLAYFTPFAFSWSTFSLLLMMTSDSATQQRSIDWKLLIRGILYAVAALTFCVGGVMLAYRTIQLKVAGVRGQAIVTQYLREVPVRRSGISWTNHLHVLSFDGRTLERETSDKHAVGSSLEIVYVPGTNNMTILSEDEASLGLVLAGVLMVLFGAGVGVVAYWVIGEQVGWLVTGTPADA